MRILDYIPFFSTFNGTIRLISLSGLSKRVHEFAIYRLHVQESSSTWSRLGRAIVTLLPFINVITLPYDYFIYIRTNGHFERGLQEWLNNPEIMGNKKAAAERIKTAYYQRATKLDLSGLSLSSLPKEIGFLQHVEIFSANGNGLQALPQEIGMLSRLQSLHIIDNKLSTLPEEVTSLKQLHILSISDNCIKTLPQFCRDLDYLGLDQSLWDSLPNERQQKLQTSGHVVIHSVDIF